MKIRRKSRTLTPQDTLNARRMRREGRSWDVIAVCLNTTRETLRRALDPDYAVKRNKQIAKRKRREPFVADEPSHPSRATDPVDLTGQILGDPGPGRSALDRKIRELFK